jgi:hypothetical protein
MIDGFDRVKNKIIAVKIEKNQSFRKKHLNLLK